MFSYCFFTEDNGASNQVGNEEEGGKMSPTPERKSDTSLIDDQEDEEDEMEKEMATLEPVGSLYKDEEVSWDAILRTRSQKIQAQKSSMDMNDMMLGDDPRVHGADTTGDNDMRSPPDNLDETAAKRGRDQQPGRAGSRRKAGKNGRGRGGRKNKNKMKQVQNQLADSATVSQAGGMQDGTEESSNYIYDQTKSPPVKFQTCEQLRCYAGGRCLPDEMRGGVRCQCMLGNSGEFCEQGKILFFQ